MRELIDAQAATESALSRRHALLIRLDQFSRELLMGLDPDSRATLPPRADKETLGFETARLEEGDARFVANAKAGEPEASSEPVLRDEIRNTSCFLLELPDAAGAPATWAIGRALTNQLVLRHPSVSKFHAYLHLGLDRRLRDAGSRNGTTVNHRPVEEMQRLCDGDELRFGAVYVQLWNLRSLSRALRGEVAR